jgi:hypothetical protein
MQKSAVRIDTSLQLVGYYDTFDPRGIRAVNPNFLNPNPDPDPAFQVNTDPGF